MTYLVFDTVTQEFLSELNEKKPLNSKWDCNVGPSGVEGAQNFDSRRGAEDVVQKLSEAFEDAGEDIEFQVIRARPVLIFEYVDWPNEL